MKRQVFFASILVSVLLAGGCASTPEQHQAREMSRYDMQANSSTAKYPIQYVTSGDRSNNARTRLSEVESATHPISKSTQSKSDMASMQCDTSAIKYESVMALVGRLAEVQLELDRALKEKKAIQSKFDLLSDELRKSRVTEMPQTRPERVASAKPQDTPSNGRAIQQMQESLVRASTLKQGPTTAMVGDAQAHPETAGSGEMFDVLIRARDRDEQNRLNRFLAEHGVGDRFVSRRGDAYTIFLGSFSRVQHADNRVKEIRSTTGLQPEIVRRHAGSI